MRAGCGEELGRCGIIDESGEWFVADGKVTAEDQDMGGHVVAVPLGQSFEEGAEGAQALRDAVATQVSSLG